MTLTWACGHRGTVKDSVTDAPICVCGERRIQRVTAPVPRFRGACRGPLALGGSETPIPVSVAPEGPLRLKG